jgi:photosystem II stability/assembly factor-like uncharacterized protein
MSEDGIVATTQGSLVYLTTNAGGSWSVVQVPPVPARDSLETFYALDADHWWVMGRDGAVIERTTDGGRHWERNRTNLPPADGATVEFVSPTVGYLFGGFQPGDGSTTLEEASALYKTTDAGQTWQIVPARELPPARAAAAD